MPKASTAFLVTLVICTLSLWGCSNQKNGATNTKIRELEMRHAKLEGDYRQSQAAGEAGRRKILQLETQRTELTQKITELEAVALERDELQAHLAIRTEERDTVQTQLLQFSKDLQNLAGRAQAAAVRSLNSSLNALPVSRKSPLNVIRDAQPQSSRGF